MKILKTSLLSVSLLSSLVTLSHAQTCFPDAVPVGPTCVDTYEASVWHILPNQQSLIDRVRRGIVTREELEAEAVAQLGAITDDYTEVGCPDTATGCTNIYAVSVRGVQPASYLTWFQAAAACRNTGKRLLRNAEWQMAAFGPQEETPCNIDTGQKRLTSSSACQADTGAYDLIGNMEEWISDWLQGSRDWIPSTGTAGPDFGEDMMTGTNRAVLQRSEQNFPSAVLRGGENSSGAPVGVFAFNLLGAPSDYARFYGFRCGR